MPSELDGVVGANGIGTTWVERRFRDIGRHQFRSLMRPVTRHCPKTD